MEHRREVLGRLAECYVVVKAVPGAPHETSLAASQGALVISVGRYGGHAAMLRSRSQASGVTSQAMRTALGFTNVPGVATTNVVVGIIGAMATA